MEKLYFTEGIWQSLLDKRGTILEEKGYVIAEKEKDKILAVSLLKVKENVGSLSHVSSDDAMLEVLDKFTDKHPNIKIITYHTHAELDDYSRGSQESDVASFINIFRETDGEMNYHIVIGPTAIKLIGVYQNPTEPKKFKLANLVHPENRKIFKIIRFSPEHIQQNQQKWNNLANDFIKIWKKQTGESIEDICQRLT